MDVCHIILGRPWQYDRKVVHDGSHNTYSFVKDGTKIKLSPMRIGGGSKSETEAKEALFTRSQVQNHVNNGEELYVLVILEENNAEKDLNPKIQPLLQEFQDVRRNTI